MKFTSTKKNAETGNRIILEVTIPWKEVETLRPAAIKELSQHVQIDGFRKGHIPEDVLLKSIPAHQILGEMADRAIQAIYIDLIKKEDVAPIGKPEIKLKKLAEGNELEFTIETDVLPVINLPKDLEKTAKKFLSPEIKVEVTDADVDGALTEIQKMRATKDKETGEETLPEINDEFAKTLGKFENLAEVREAIKENLEHEKTHHEIDKRHGDFYEALVESVDAEVPQSIVDFEIQKRIAQLEHDTSMAGATLDEYLKSIKKTREEIISEIKPAAERSSKLELIFNEIAAQNNLTPDEKAIEAEVQAAVERYKDVKDFNIHSARDYFFTVHKNRMVVNHLDKLGGLPHIHEDEHHHHD